MSSISSFGMLVPIIVDKNDVVVAGDARLVAAKELGLNEVPVIRADHLSEGQVKAFRLADNKIPEFGQWDQAKLAIELAAIIDIDDVSVDLSGFETAEIDVILAAGGNDPASPDPDDTPVEVQDAVSQSGDLWMLNGHRLLCGSVMEASHWAKLLQGRHAAMVFSDPPYNVPVNGHVSSTGRHGEFAQASGEMSREQFTAFLLQAVSAMAALLKDGAVLDLCMDFRHLSELFAAVEQAGLSVLNLCVWNKTNGGMGSLYRSKHELVLITKKGIAPHVNNVELGKHGRYRTNVWDYAGANSFGASRDADLADHPTVKPIALVADAIRDVTQPGDIVLDGFMGSGTTLLAAERTKRIACGTELEARYVDVAIRRWERMTGQQATLASSGETFAAVADRRGNIAIDDGASSKSRSKGDAVSIPHAAAPRIRRREHPARI